MEGTILVYREYELENDKSAGGKIKAARRPGRNTEERKECANDRERHGRHCALRERRKQPCRRRTRSRPRTTRSRRRRQRSRRRQHPRWQCSRHRRPRRRHRTAQCWTASGEESRGQFICFFSCKAREGSLPRRRCTRSPWRPQQCKRCATPGRGCGG